ncbi:hypothetical protein AAC387_Pa01g3817 [Persea americana]
MRTYLEQFGEILEAVVITNKNTRREEGYGFYSVRAGGSGDEGKVARRKETNSWKIDFSGEKPATPLLDTINYPIHMKNLSTRDFDQLAAELRADIVYSVSKTVGRSIASNSNNEVQVKEAMFKTHFSNQFSYLEELLDRCSKPETSSSAGERDRERRSETVDGRGRCAQ